MGIMEYTVREINDYIKDKGLEKEYYAKLSKDAFLGESISIMLKYQNGSSGVVFSSTEEDKLKAFIDSKVS